MSGHDDLFFCAHEKIVRLGKICVHFVHADIVQVYSDNFSYQILIPGLTHPNKSFTVILMSDNGTLLDQTHPWNTTTNATQPWFWRLYILHTIFCVHGFFVLPAICWRARCAHENFRARKSSCPVSIKSIYDQLYLTWGIQ